MRRDRRRANAMRAKRATESPHFSTSRYEAARRRGRCHASTTTAGSSTNQQPLGRGLLIRATIEASHQALIDHRVRDFHEARNVGAFDVVDISRRV